MPLQILSEKLTAAGTHAYQNSDFHLQAITLSGGNKN